MRIPRNCLPISDHVEKLATKKQELVSQTVVNEASSVASLDDLAELHGIIDGMATCRRHGIKKDLIGKED